MEQADPSTIPTDVQIIQRVRAGNVQAYGSLVERYERGVLAMALATLRDAHAAQDVVQDVFVHCFIKLSNLRDGSRFSYWLMKVARRRDDDQDAAPHHGVHRVQQRSQR
jgi:DNA-directed RNA polymerase specialized sigma24 family protein